MSDECKHGSLRRSCEICERDEEIERLRSGHDEAVKQHNMIIDHYKQRIEELEKESEWKAMKQLLCADYHIITTEQIDKAWEFNEDSSPEIKAHGRAMLYSCFKVDACEKCGGSGKLDNGPGYPVYCDECEGHGWIITSQLVDKCGRLGTGDDDEK